MRKIRKTLSVLLSLIIMLGVFTAAPATAVTSAPTGRNTARRDISATSLSSKALSYYTDEVKAAFTDSDGNGSISADEVYATFLDLADNQNNSGVDSYIAVQNNDLYDTLYGIMSKPHTHTVYYSGTGSNSLAYYWLTTDSSVIDAGNETSYTFFYSNVSCENNTKIDVVPILF